MQQKALLKNFCHLDKQDWSLIHQPNVTILVNNHTSDQFIYERVNSNSWHLVDIYKARSQYVMPNTPQIILSQVQNQNNTIQMFIQYAPFGVDRLIKRNTCQTTIYQILKCVIKTIENLVKKFGFFKLYNQMIRVTKSQNIIVWVHENFTSTHRQVPLNSKNIYEDYKIMITDLLTIFQNAGCKKQIEDIKQKIQTQKLLSFERLKLILENNLKCSHKTEEKSGRHYQSPQFIKRRNNSPNSITQRSATQNFSILPKPMSQTRFVTSLNLGSTNNGIPYHSQTSSTSNKQQGRLSDKQENQQFLEQVKGPKSQYSPNLVQKSTKSMFIMLSHPPKLQHHVSVSKTGSQTTQKVCQTQLSALPQMINMRKKNFRDSGNSVATTAFINSMTSSGKLKFTGLDQHNYSSTTSLVGNNDKNLASTLGMKQKNKIKDIKEIFKVKASKIIQQNSQEVCAPHSFIRSQKDHGIRQSELQRDFNDILESQTSSKYRPSNDLLELENQINMILLG